MDKEFIDNAKSDQLTDEDLDKVAGGSDLKLRVSQSEESRKLIALHRPVIRLTKD